MRCSRAVLARCVASPLLGTFSSAPPVPNLPRKKSIARKGAIDAARAAGAEQYANRTVHRRDHRDAADARSRAQRDYRLALSRAVDANERALEAARQAANGKARARGDVERTITSVTTSLQQLQTLIKAEAARLPAPLLTSAKREATHTQTALQKARTLLDAEQYLDARDALTGVEERTDAQLKAVTEAGKSRPVRRRTG